MDKRKKRKILVKTPNIRYDGQLEAIPKLNGKIGIRDSMKESYQCQIPSYNIIQKLARGLINIGNFGQEPQSFHSSYKNKNFINEDSSKIIIRPKLNKTFFSSEKNQQILIRRSSNEAIGKSSCLSSSFSRTEQTERARRFFLQPCSKTPDLRPPKNLYGLKQKIRMNHKRLFNLLN